jgi:Domain of Unknown Function (DUF928)
MKRFSPMTSQSRRIALGLIANLLVGVPIGISAPPSFGAMSIASNPSVLAFKPPSTPATGRPKGTRRIAGGHRGQCPQVATPLTAIVPLTEAQTLAPRPTLWFYSPYDGIRLPARFTLQRQGEIVAEIPITLPTTPGLVRVQLPETVALDVDQSYEWFLAVNCTKGPSSQPPLEVEGSLRRVAVPPRTPAAPREQVAFYAEHGLWLDAVTILLERRLATPQAVPPEWPMVLEALDLKEFATTPVVP